MKKGLFLLSCVGIVSLLGCSQEAATESESETPVYQASAEGEKYLLSEAPADAKEVIAVRDEAADGDEVTIVGRIGGRIDPWTEGQAAFTLVDNSLKACTDIPGDMCKTPWDYCCVSGKKLAASTALIKVVNDQGELVKVDSRNLLPVKELSTVVVKGKAKRDESGNLTVLADGIYVQKD